MNDRDHIHTPRAEFRAALENQLISAFRDSYTLAPPVSHRRSRWRAALPLAAGLLLGVGVNFAAGQVQDARDRGDVIAALNMLRAVAELKLAVARQEVEMARTRFAVGTVSQTSLLAAESSFRAQESELRKLDLSVEEAKITAASPRDELWAPVVNGRDFVQERLRIDAARASQHVAAAEAALASGENSYRVGALSPSGLSELKSNVGNARADLDLLAQKEVLRKEFLAKIIGPEEVTRRLQMLEITDKVQRLLRSLDLARERIGVTRQQIGRGTADSLELKRTELVTMELQYTIEQLKLQLLQMRAKKGG